MLLLTIEEATDKEISGVLATHHELISRLTARAMRTAIMIGLGLGIIMSFATCGFVSKVATVADDEGANTSHEQIVITLK